MKGTKTTILSKSEGVGALSGTALQRPLHRLLLFFIYHLMHLFPPMSDSWQSHGGKAVFRRSYSSYAGFVLHPMGPLNQYTHARTHKPCPQETALTSVLPMVQFQGRLSINTKNSQTILYQLHVYVSLFPICRRSLTFSISFFSVT